MAVIHLNKENMKATLEDKKPLVMDFWAPWCGPCQMMGPVFDELEKEMGDKVRFAKLNTEDEPELAGGFGIRGIPTLIVFNEGKEAERLVGFKQKEQLKEDILNALK